MTQPFHVILRVVELPALPLTLLEEFALKIAFALPLLLTAVFSSQAFACQPPYDVPSDPVASAKFWEDRWIASEKASLKRATTIMIADVSQVRTVHDKPEPGFRTITATLTPVRVLKGETAAPRTVSMSLWWCSEHPATLQDGRHLLAMEKTYVNWAVPLDKGAEKAGVARFYARINEPNPFE